MKKSNILPQYVAEFIGTFCLVFFGCGAVILHETNPQAMPGFIIPLVFGGTVSIMIYAVGHISGAHFNPAVSIAFTVARKFPIKKLPGYIGAQTLAAIIASLAHFMIWGPDHSFGATQISSTLGVGIGLELFLTFVLMFVITSVATDTRAVGELAGLAIGSTVTLCAFVGGPLTGASMNPARTLGPALVSGQWSTLWVYLAFPVLGAALGAIVYDRIRCYSEEESQHGCC